MNPVIHQFSHMPDVLEKRREKLGPAWSYSTFAFEDENGHLLKNIRGPCNVIVQIFNRLNLQCFYDDRRNLEAVTENIQQFCRGIKYGLTTTTGNIVKRFGQNEYVLHGKSHFSSCRESHSKIKNKTGLKFISQLLSTNAVERHHVQNI